MNYSYIQYRGSLLVFVTFVSKSQKTVNESKKIISTKFRMVVVSGVWEMHRGRCSLLFLFQSSNPMVIAQVFVKYFKKNVWMSEWMSEVE